VVYIFCCDLALVVGFVVLMVTTEHYLRGCYAIETCRTLPTYKRVLLPQSSTLIMNTARCYETYVRLVVNVMFVDPCIII